MVHWVSTKSLHVVKMLHYLSWTQYYQQPLSILRGIIYNVSLHPADANDIHQSYIISHSYLTWVPALTVSSCVEQYGDIIVVVIFCLMTLWHEVFFFELHYYNFKWFVSALRKYIFCVYPWLFGFLFYVLCFITKSTTFFSTLRLSSFCFSCLMYILCLYCFKLMMFHKHHAVVRTCLCLYLLHWLYSTCFLLI